jgi:hypothetical protein
MRSPVVTLPFLLLALLLCALSTANAKGAPAASAGKRTAASTASSTATLKDAEELGIPVDSREFAENKFFEYATYLNIVDAQVARFVVEGFASGINITQLADVITRVALEPGTRLLKGTRIQCGREDKYSLTPAVPGRRSVEREWCRLEDILIVLRTRDPHTLQVNLDAFPLISVVNFADPVGGINVPEGAVQLSMQKAAEEASSFSRQQKHVPH